MVLRFKTWHLYYNNPTGTGSGGIEGSQGTGGNNPPPTPDPNVEKKFSQADVNRFVAEQHKKVLDQNKQLIGQLEDLQKNTSLTQRERDELQAKIEDIQNQSLTKEEQYKREMEKAEKKRKTEVETISGDRDGWRNKYNTLETTLHIREAAKGLDAFNEDQMVEVLLPRAKMVERLDDKGKGLGEYYPVISFTDEKDGKPLSAEMPVLDAIKRMKELPTRYGNLFKSEVNGGLGINNRTTSGGQGAIQYRDDMSDEEYQKWRKQENLVKDKK